jgi:PIN domain nuclease of toxin-antitoxin system
VKGVFCWGAGENGGLIKDISSTAQAEISPEKSSGTLSLSSVYELALE